MLDNVLVEAALTPSPPRLLIQEASQAAILLPSPLAVAVAAGILLLVFLLINDGELSMLI